MDNQEEPKEKEEEKSKENSNDGNKYETTPIIERAREEREKLETANKTKEELLDREEKIMARRELGGRAEAGGATPKPKDERTQDQKDIEYANNIMDGTFTVADILDPKQN